MAASDPDADITLASSRGPIRCRYHAPAAPLVGATLLVGGTDGGLDGPADAIYADLAQRLLPQGIGTLRLDFRLHAAPGVVEEGVFDVLHGMAFLREQGAVGVGLVGHSFGGAVVITAATQAPEVRTVVTLATQSAGAQLAPRVAPRPLLLVHGSEDIRLPPACSEYVYQIAREPKELIILPGARHSLRQRRGELLDLLVTWLTAKLRQPQPAPGKG
ncbi:MAG: alpha/beta hydrolase [Chloroflexi bacterium]|nr:alpha/beta hydrolase [Chloroflexota bacterium]